MSTVRAGLRGKGGNSIGFVADKRRMNVSMTRPRLNLPPPPLPRGGHGPAGAAGQGPLPFHLPPPPTPRYTSYSVVLR